MPIPELSKPERVPVRDIWPDEARDFTPWLAENLDLLSATVGINLELVQEETALPRSGRVDILAKVAGSDAYVVIENQMEDADNDHLAALLNYAAHSDSEILIWVAGGFSLRYRRTIDWLNSSTGLRIYGVKMSAWRNGETIERRLNPIVGPNQRVEWPKYGYPAINQKYNTFFSPWWPTCGPLEYLIAKCLGSATTRYFPAGLLASSTMSVFGTALVADHPLTCTCGSPRLTKNVTKRFSMR